MRDTVADYDRYGEHYRSHRRADPDIRARIQAGLGDARTVLNVGAGTGSYEPTDRYVVAVEPSATMRRQRSATLPPALIGTADALPYDDGAFDAAMAVLTVHHWPDLARGLGEMRRVAAGPVVVMSFDPDAPTDFWMPDYLPEMAAVERARYPAIERLCDGLGGGCRVAPVQVRRDCPDKFQVALYARPEAFLNPQVRHAQSAWRFLADGVEERFVRDLARDLASGAWDARYGHLRAQSEIRCQLRLVTSAGKAAAGGTLACNEVTDGDTTR